MSRPATLPPRSCVVCAFADRVVEADDWRSKGVQVPGIATKVKSIPLASHLLAVTLWGLQADGVLALRLEEKKRLGIRTSKLLVSAVGAPGAPLTGLDAAALAAVRPGAETRVEDVVTAVVGDDFPDPFAAVVDRVLADAAAAGMYEEVVADGRGAVARLVKGRTELVPVPAALAALEPHFAQLAAQWQAFATAQPQLAAQLLSRCEKAIASRTEADDDID